MKVVVHEAAAADLDDIFEWIAEDSKQAAVASRKLVRKNFAGLLGG